MDASLAHGLSRSWFNRTSNARQLCAVPTSGCARAAAESGGFLLLDFDCVVTDGPLSFNEHVPRIIGTQKALLRLMFPQGRSH
jgi:hypothetical protein